MYRVIPQFESIVFITDARMTSEAAGYPVRLVQGIVRISCTGLLQQMAELGQCRTGAMNSSLRWGNPCQCFRLLNGAGIVVHQGRADWLAIDIAQQQGPGSAVDAQGKGRKIILQKEFIKYP